MKCLSQILVLVALFTSSGGAFAEEGFKASGTISVAANADSYFLNFGGPQLRWDAPRFFFGASFFPSLRYSQDESEVYPLLGAGIFIGKDKFFVQVPTYFYSGAWYSAIGVGYKF